MTDTKRQNLPGSLHVVATPIGNLGDLSPRAKEALATAQVVYCEDTRRTAQLGNALGISMKLERLDAHADAGRIEYVASRLAAGEVAALVTDAGTPGVSDPAAALVSRARGLGVKIVPIPGPSAVAALLSVCGFPESNFAFRGFFPRKEGDRITELQEAAHSPGIRIVIWFESPERIAGSLECLAKELPGSEVVVGKELTKLHERFFAGSAPVAYEAVRDEIDREGTRGEWCFACRFPTAQVESGGLPEAGSANWEKALRCLIEAGISVSEASRKVSQSFDVPKKAVYAEALRLSEAQ